MHKLDRLEQIIGERIVSLREEMEIASNACLNIPDIENLKEEVRFLEWSTQQIRLTTTHNGIQRAQNDEIMLGNSLQELQGIVQFEKILAFVT